MKRYYYDYEFETGKHYTGAHEIMYGIGRIIGLALMFGGGVVIGQVIRGIMMAIM